MPTRLLSSLRNNLPVLLIVPLVVIVTTWPTFPRLFDGDEFWLHIWQKDQWLKIWDAWHFERVLAGQAQLYYTDAIAHPLGQSLTYRAFIFPHALFMVALSAIIPVDDAYNLLFLLILCFNGFCGYALIKHLIKDKWIPLFGAVVFAVATPFPSGSTVPDVIMIGTLPLTIYFLHRSMTEKRKRFAGLAGICAGITAFISVYVLGIILLSVGIIALIMSLPLWRKQFFWRNLLIFFVVCALISLLRFYPMLADRADLRFALEVYKEMNRSNDVLEYFVLSNNPFIGELFGSTPDPSDDNQVYTIRKYYKDAYLGYSNLILMACAFLFLSRRRRLLLWIALLVFFATLGLGSFLTLNGIEYTNILLPERFLRDWFPALFGNIGSQKYYQMGVITPLAVLSCYGLAALLKSKPIRARRLVVLFCALLVCLEFYLPLLGQTLERNKTAYVTWLRSEPDYPIKLINLPYEDGTPQYFQYLQTLTGYPQANGFSSRQEHSTRHYILGNSLLHSWDESRNIHCLPHNEQSFAAALDQLLADGFTHIVMHKWLYGDQFIIQSFKNIPPAYDNGHVSVYRVRDLRLSCQNQAAQLPRFIHFAQSSMAAPGSRSAILSIHPDQPIDPDLFEYLGSLFSDWRSLVHLYLDNGELVMQSAGARYPDMDAFTKDKQVVHLLYDLFEVETDLLNSYLNFDEFILCQRDANDDGAVIELYVNRTFSCELVTSADRFTVQYDNGIRLENLEIQTDQDVMDFQFMWSNLPDEAHSVSIQVFDATGEKALGQDSVIGHVTLDGRHLDISDLEPGKYQIKLIAYSFVTGKTVAGVVTATGARFDRALVIANFNHS